MRAAQQNQAVFAFKLAREATGRLKAAYRQDGSRAALLADPEFAHAFSQAKARICEMDLRFVEETDPLRQALLEIYVSVVLKNPYTTISTLTSLEASVHILCLLCRWFDAG